MWPFSKKVNVVVWFKFYDNGVLDGVWANLMKIDIRLAKRLGEKDKHGVWNIGKDNTLTFDCFPFPTEEQLFEAYFEQRVRFYLADSAARLFRKVW